MQKHRTTLQLAEMRLSLQLRLEAISHCPIDEPRWRWMRLLRLHDIVSLTIAGRLDGRTLIQRIAA